MEILQQLVDIANKYEDKDNVLSLLLACHTNPFVGRIYADMCCADSVPLLLKNKDLIESNSHLLLNYGNLTPQDNYEEWINEWRKKFSRYTSLKGHIGIKDTCIVKMKDLFQKNPDLTREQVDKATDLYISECVKTKTFLKAPQNFIWSQKETKATRVWPIEEYLDRVKKGEEVDEWNTLI